MGKKVPATNFSRSWMRVDETDDPSFYAGMLEATGPKRWRRLVVTRRRRLVPSV